MYGVWEGSYAGTYEGKTIERSGLISVSLLNWVIFMVLPILIMARTVLTALMERSTLLQEKCHLKVQIG